MIKESGKEVVIEVLRDVKMEKAAMEATEKMMGEHAKEVITEEVIPSSSARFPYKSVCIGLIVEFTISNFVVPPGCHQSTTHFFHTRSLPFCSCSKRSPSYTLTH